MITQFKISGLTCGACAKIAEKRIEKVDGVQYAKVNKATDSAEITGSRQFSADEINEALKELGYKIIN